MLLIFMFHLLISIHAPLTGCDVLFYAIFRILAISIHAPLTGCDLKHYQGFY